MPLFKYKLFTPPIREESLQLFQTSSRDASRRGGSKTLTILSPLEEISPISESPREATVGDATTRRLKAIVLAILSGLAFTYCALTVHLLRHISPSEVLLFRTGVQTLLISPVALWSLRHPYQSSDDPSAIGVRCTCTPWLSILAQGTVMAVSLQLLFIAFQRLPLGDASALIFSAPAHVSILAWVILGERPNVVKCVAILGIVAGGILVCQTTPRTLGQPKAKREDEVGLDPAGLAAAVVGTLGYSLHYVLIRRLRSVHYSLTTLSLSAQTFILSALILIFSEDFQVPKDEFDWSLLSTVGVVGTAAHVLLAIALSLEEAAVVASTRSLDIAVAYVIQVAVCHEPLDPVGVGGATLISVCVFFIALEPYIVPKACDAFVRLKDLVNELLRRRYS